MSDLDVELMLTELIVQMELGSLVTAGRLKTSIIGQDVLVTRNEVRLLLRGELGL